MYVEQGIETVHLYIVPEQENQPINLPRIINRILCGIFASVLLTLPSQFDLSPKTMLVPLQFLPPQIFSTTVSVEPTGKKVIPATTAQGALTIYNGSIFVQQIPKGFLVIAQDGTEIITDEEAVIPAGNPPFFGTVRVPAHAVLPGVAGNIPVLSINTNYGGSLYLKNLTAFRGGNDSYTIPSASETDKLTALTMARSILMVRQKSYPALLDQPCGETSTQDNLLLIVSWHCQFVTYQAPKGVRVISVERKGGSVLLTFTTVGR